jgi:CRP-like cAMP-binding protein
MVERSDFVTQEEEQEMQDQQVIEAVERAVERNEIFGDLLTSIEKEYLLDRGIVRSVAPGVKLCQQHQRDDRVFILVVGEVEASAGEDTGKTHIASIRQGELFGEIAALFGMPRICDITVTRPSVILDVPSHVLRTIVEARAELRNAVMRRFRERITETALRAVPLFRYLPDDLMQKLVSHASLVGAPAGSIIVEENEPGDAFYVVIYGSLRVSHDVNGRHLNLASLHAGDYFGEWSLMTGSPRNATVSALLQSELVRVEKDAFLEVMDANSEVRDHVDMVAHNRHDQLVSREALCTESRANQNLDEIKNIIRQQS